jgi:predicted dehydrogenase
MAVTPHAKSLLDLADRVEVAWAMSPSAARRDSFAARFPFPTADNLTTTLDDRSFTAVVVRTPPNTHLEIASQLAEAGKHILLEKPLEVSSARAEQLVAICAAAGVTLGVVLQHRFKPAAERLTAILQGRWARSSTARRASGCGARSTTTTSRAAARKRATGAAC